jgi:DNA-binding response OmpR family regulator
MCRKVLLIEDSRDLAELMALHLSDLNCEVTVAADGGRGLQMANAGSYNLIVLDLRLPSMDGLEVCRSLRSRRNYTPVLMVTVRAGELDRVLGLEIGADDYLVKPFGIPEFVARAKAQLRRVEQFAKRDLLEQENILAGPIFIEIERRLVSVENRKVELTAKEFDLLVELVKHPGRVYTRAQLLDLVWGHGHDGYEHTIDCHINRLRGKIEKNQGDPSYILTVRGVGYKFSDMAEP